MQKTPASEASGFAFSGVVWPEDGPTHYGLRYAEFVVPLTQAVQQIDATLSETADDHESSIARLEALVAQQQTLLATQQERLKSQDALLARYEALVAQLASSPTEASPARAAGQVTQPPPQR